MTNDYEQSDDEQERRAELAREQLAPRIRRTLGFYGNYADDLRLSIVENMPKPPERVDVDELGSSPVFETNELLQGLRDEVASFQDELRRVREEAVEREQELDAAQAEALGEERAARIAADGRAVKAYRVAVASMIIAIVGVVAAVLVPFLAG